jgi:nucleoid-associated protein YgaU
MPSYPAISVRQPQPFDIVDDPVMVCGVGAGFEGVFAARVRDANGNQVAYATINAGGSGIWGNYHVSLPLGGPPATRTGTLEVFEPSAKGDGTELNKVVINIAFGPALIDPYHGFQQYTVEPGDTLSKIAQATYGNANQWPLIDDANRDEISNPDLIFPGQVLRLPA